MKAVTKFALRAAAVAALASGLSPLALGQSAQQAREEALRKEMSDRAAADERRMQSWELEMAGVRRPPEKRRDAALAYAQIREDYKQLQIVNNELAKAVAAGGALDFKYVARAVSEIKTRAARLKENLMLPEPKKAVERPKPELAAEATALKSSLLTLDKLVMEFVDSPIFAQAKTVNVEQAADARRRLEEIIEISEQIKKGSEKLKNLGQKAQ